MKVLYVTDLHGNKAKYALVEKKALEHKVDVLINGGDMLPFGEDAFSVQSKFIDEVLRRHFEALREAGVRCLCMLGNDDLAACDEGFASLCGEFALVENIAQRKVSLNGFEFVGFNLVPDYPFRLKDRCRRDGDDFTFPPQLGTGIVSEEKKLHELKDWQAYAEELPTIEKELSNLLMPENVRRAVFVMHCPPAGLGLDVCYGNKKVGSEAVYSFLKENQPLISLHGHIHESPEVSEVWRARLGQTVCVQPGQAGKLTYVVIDLDTMDMARQAN